MSNNRLYDKTFRVPSSVLKHIQAVLVSNPHGEGVKRAKHILKNGILTYQTLKRLKNYFDYYNPSVDNKTQYELAGGQMMKSYIEQTLNAERDSIDRGDRIKQDIGVDVNLGTKGYKTPRLNESKKKLDKNALAIIVNSDNKFLLLKRSDYSKQWMPGKWALVGGAIEKGESPEQACKREVKEETGLEINKVIKTFNIQRNPDSIEHIFACRFNGDSFDVELNEENVSYGWFSINEINFLDIVPNLIEYITLAFKEYE